MLNYSIFFAASNTSRWVLFYRFKQNLNYDFLISPSNTNKQHLGKHRLISCRVTKN